jgi:membrane associated rhomboid family serine protease
MHEARDGAVAITRYLLALITFVVIYISLSLIISGTFAWASVVGIFIGMTAVFLINRWREVDQQPNTKQ